MATAPTPLTGITALAPSFEHMKNRLFRGFRFGVWSRLALVALATGEFAGGGAPSGGGNLNLSPPTSQKRELLGFFAPSGPDLWAAILPWILVIAVLVVVLLLVAIYISSVCRFILFDAVLTGRYGLRESWRRWEEQGLRYFGWQLLMMVAVLAALAVMIGPIIWIAVTAKGQARGALAAAITTIILLFFAGLLLIMGVMVAVVLTKDFVVPYMALEAVGVTEGWRRLSALMATDWKNYAGYILMKAVLSVGSAMFFGLIDVIVILLLAVPGVAVGLIFAALWPKGAAPISWIAAAVIAGVVGLSFLFYLIAFISVPATYFFQSYALHFQAARYPRLASSLWPAPAAPAAPAESPA